MVKDFGWCLAVCPLFPSAQFFFTCNLLLFFPLAPKPTGSNTLHVVVTAITGREHSNATLPSRKPLCLGIRLFFIHTFIACLACFQHEIPLRFVSAPISVPTEIVTLSVQGKMCPSTPLDVSFHSLEEGELKKKKN